MIPTDLFKILPIIDKTTSQALQIVESVRAVVHSTVDYEPLKNGGFRITVKPSEKTKTKSTITEEDISKL